MLQSSKETSVTSDVKSYNTKSTKNFIDILPALSRQGSIQSDLSSIHETEFSGAQGDPIEVAEIRSSGNVSSSVYFSFISAGGKVYKILFLILICVFAQILCTCEDFWISYWYIEYVLK